MTRERERNIDYDEVLSSSRGDGDGDGTKRNNNTTGLRRRKNKAADGGGGRNANGAGNTNGVEDNYLTTKGVSSRVSVSTVPPQLPTRTKFGTTTEDDDGDDDDNDEYPSGDMLVTNNNKITPNNNRCKSDGMIHHNPRTTTATTTTTISSRSSRHQSMIQQHQQLLRSERSHKDIPLSSGIYGSKVPSHHEMRSVVKSINYVENHGTSLGGGGGGHHGIRNSRSIFGSKNSDDGGGFSSNQMGTATTTAREAAAAATASTSAAVAAAAASADCDDLGSCRTCPSYDVEVVGCNNTHKLLPFTMDHYTKVKPPSYFDYPQLNHLYMTRERERNIDYDEVLSSSRGDGDGDGTKRNNNTTGLRRRKNKAAGGGGASGRNANGAGNTNGVEDNYLTTKGVSSRVSVSTVPPQLPTRTKFGTTNEDDDDDDNDEYPSGDMLVTNNNKITPNNNRCKSDGMIHHNTRTTTATTTAISSRSSRHQSMIQQHQQMLRSERSHKDIPLSSGTYGSKVPSHHEMRSVVKSINYVENHSTSLGGGGHHHGIRNSRSIFGSKNSDDGGGFGSNKMRTATTTAAREAAAAATASTSAAVAAAAASADCDDSVESVFFAEHLHHSGDDEEGDDSLINTARDPTPLWGRPRLDGNWGAYYTKNPNHPLATFYDPTNPSYVSPKGFASTAGGRTPPLFLQELAHLSSLLVAVALSTLRNDSDGSESPLGCYEPGAPWPAVDPAEDEYVQMEMGSISSIIKTFLSTGRSPEEQTRFNALRPLPVIGGVSDAEIRFLQMARGPSAKTQLCWNWLSEFIIREHLAGSTGKVGPPIISRIIQFLGDGMIYYNHARKVMFVPFPFVHAQISVIFNVVVIFYAPFLMFQYVSEIWLGSTLTFFLVLCLCGINEVARELENPFRNIPNELPLVTFAAQYNESLYTMYAGYHPDLFWDGDRVLRNASGGLDDYDERTKRRSKESPGVGCRHQCESKENGPATESGTTAQHTTRQDAEPHSPSDTAKSVDDTTTEVCDSSSSNTTASVSMVNRGDSPQSVDSEEIAALKKELEKQAKIIERLFAKVGNIDDLDIGE
eukprot:CAMPEP_0113512770 /NCGR_PEP_ID=MMETSP0014_2-20120614/39510_1 /TAXON_ID=2857 /ORGANISM="Nitzschia sp." /LENGTH=1072 /DNA_ID=CAMNT_0000409137 /DNA_START=198 /DNA_END=3417 /DNA_ORIENTATION=+ /assembly_acc=CAM_ASM_000159